MLGAKIAYYRKNKNLTQEQLAKLLEVTNQAVSKWETDQCCPDVALLPRIADVFGITIDALFGRETVQTAKELPWKNDNALHIVVYNGHTLIGAASSKNKQCTFCYEGPAKDIYCGCNIECGDVEGNVEAEGYVECGDIGGGVKAGGYVECGDVDGNLSSGSYVECGDVGGNLTAGSYVECGDVGGNVSSASYVECGDIGGSAAGSNFCGFDPFNR